MSTLALFLPLPAQVLRFFSSQTDLLLRPLTKFSLTTEGGKAFWEAQGGAYWLLSKCLGDSTAWAGTSAVVETGKAKTGKSSASRKQAGLGKF